MKFPHPQKYVCIFFSIPSMRIVLYLRFLTNLGLVMEAITLWIIKRDSLVRGDSSLDSNNMNLGKVSSVCSGFESDSEWGLLTCFCLFLKP